MNETKQVKSEYINPEITIKPEVKLRNPKRVEAGKKGAEARRLKKMQQPVMEVTKPESTTPENPVENQIKINVYKTYLPACLVMIGIAALYMYKKKPVEQVERETVKTETKQYDPLELKKNIFFMNINENDINRRKTNR